MVNSNHVSSGLLLSPSLFHTHARVKFSVHRSPTAYGHSRFVHRPATYKRKTENSENVNVRARARCTRDIADKCSKLCRETSETRHTREYDAYAELNVNRAEFAGRSCNPRSRRFRAPRVKRNPLCRVRVVTLL